MESIGGNAVRMELKYCERCGGLWLRLKGSDLVYCPACSMVLAGVVRDPRFLSPSANQNQTETEDTFWVEGGQA
jgi:hypothetical protein